MNSLETRIRTGTTIVAARTDHEVVIGADCKSILGTAGRGGRGSSTEYVTKITQAGHLFFACSGLVDHDQTDFHVERIVAESIREGGTIPEILTGLEPRIGFPLYNALTQISLQAPELYRELLPQNGAKTSVLIAGIENNTPVLSYRDITPNIPSDPVACEIIRGDDVRNPAVGVAPIVMGVNDCISELLTQEPDFLLRTGLVAGVRRLIEIEIAAHPEKVGQPVTIIRIDRRGAKWAVRPAHCPPIQRYW